LNIGTVDMYADDFETSNALSRVRGTFNTGTSVGSDLNRRVQAQDKVGCICGALRSTP